MDSRDKVTRHPFRQANMSVPFLELTTPHVGIASELSAAFSGVLESGQFVLGPQVELFEERWANYCEAKFCIGVGNGLDALHLILKALEIGPGDEVIVPANTFIATWLAVSMTGATPVAVEPNPETFNIESSGVALAITPKTKVVIAVHLYGQPADLDDLQSVCDANELMLIEDAAQAHGSRYKGRRVGGHSVAAAWSFYPGKNLGALGDGGGITTNDATLASKLRVLRNYGSERKYVHDVEGVNSRLDEVQASLLSVKLDYLNVWNSRRAEIASSYLSVLSGLMNKEFSGGRSLLVSIPLVPPWAEPVWHLFVIRVRNRDLVAERLLSAGIQSSIHYPIPPAWQGAYGSLAAHLTTSDSAVSAQQLLSLPIGPHLSDEQVEHVVKVLPEVLVE